MNVVGMDWLIAGATEHKVIHHLKEKNAMS